MALLLCLHELSKRHDFELRAVHLEHGIRGEASREDAAFVSDKCRELGIPLFVQNVDVPSVAKERNLSLELAGRQAREAFFAELCRLGDVDVVATAHHMEDNAESVLLHALRGCGLEGLVGIHPHRGFLIRPFLCLSKEDILTYLRLQDETWREDASNQDTSYTRNYLRQVVMPLLRERINPQVSLGLNRLARMARRDSAFLETMSAAEFTRIVREDGSDVRMEAAELMQLDPALRSRVILEALRLAGRVTDVEHVHVEDIEALAKANRTGSRIDLGAGLQARLEYAQVVIAPWQESVPRLEEVTVHWGRNVLANGDELIVDDVCERGSSTAFREYIDADKLPADMAIRNRRPGDVFQPLHAPGKRKLKEYFIDRKLPRQLRDTVPLLAHGNRILWAVGHVLSEDVCIDADTKHICRLTYVPVLEE